MSMHSKRGSGRLPTMYLFRKDNGLWELQFLTPSIRKKIISSWSLTEENYQFLVIDKFNSDGYTFKVSPLLVYGIKNNLALGGRFSYGRTLTRFDNVGFSLDDDLTIDLNDTYELTHSYSVMGIMRNYINLGSSKRFALYAETQLKFGGSQSKLVTKEGNELTGTYSTSTDLGIGVRLE